MSAPQAQQSSGIAQKADPTSQSLQRLDFLKAYTEYAVNKSTDVAGSLYQTSRSFTPSFLEPRVQAVEGKAKEVASNYGAPIVNAVQDKSSQVLGVVDKQASVALLCDPRRRGRLAAAFATVRLSP